MRLEANFSSNLCIMALVTLGKCLTIFWSSWPTITIFSKFIPPGSKRIGLSIENVLGSGLPIVDFLRPDGLKVVVACNEWVQSFFRYLRVCTHKGFTAVLANRVTGLPSYPCSWVSWLEALSRWVLLETVSWRRFLDKRVTHLCLGNRSTHNEAGWGEYFGGGSSVSNALVMNSTFWLLIDHFR